MNHLRLYLLIFLFIPNALVAKSITAEDFGSIPDVVSVQISPDGTKILMLRNINSKITLVTRKLNDEDGVEHIIPNEDGIYNWAIWASNDRILASIRYRGHEDRGRNFQVKLQRRLVSMTWDGKKQINPVKFRKLNRLSRAFIKRQPQIQDTIVDILRDDPDHILLQLDIDTVDEPAVYKVNIKTRKRTRVLKSRRAVDFWVTDQNHDIRYAEGTQDTYGKDIVRHVAFYRKNKTSAWRALFDYNMLEQGRPFYFEGITKDPNVVYITQDDENGKRALYTYDVDQKKRLKKVAGGSDYDIANVNFDDNFEIEYYQYYLEKPVFVRFGERGKLLDNLFNEHFPNQTVSIESQSKNKNKIIVSVTSPIVPPEYYYMNIEDDIVEKIAASYQNIDRDKLSPMLPVSYIARDGLEIPAYLSLPKEKEKNLPTVILPHGGPMARDGWNFDYWAQFLTTRGYAVLQMNYRGSTGYGEAFRKAGYHEWGGKMLDDIDDGTKWMIEKGYADPNNICIMGASYGGYAALQNSARGDVNYKCAIAFAPISNISALMHHLRNINGFKAYFEYVQSDKWTFEEVSPSSNIDKINIPVLLMHGSDDLSVTVLQSRSFYESMKEAGKDIRYVEFEDEGHFLSSEKYRIQLLKEIETFLQRAMDK